MVTYTRYPFFNLGSRRGGCQTPRSGRFTPGKYNRYPLHRKMRGSQDRTGRCGKYQWHRDSIPGRHRTCHLFYLQIGTRSVNMGAIGLVQLSQLRCIFDVVRPKCSNNDTKGRAYITRSHRTSSSSADFIPRFGVWNLVLSNQRRPHG